jgi:hypothetical protein
MINLDEMKTDREAGTQGPWALYSRDGKSPSSRVVNESGDAEIGTWAVADAMWLPDARRIARVPELEEAVIALTALNTDLKDALRVIGRETYLDNIGDRWPTRAAIIAQNILKKPGDE